MIRASALLAALAVAAPAVAEKTPRPAIGAGYQPVDKAERGLWMEMDEAERRLKTSDFVIADPALNAYVREVFCRTVGPADCASVRIYITRTPYFNASMAPNGMMQVWSGLFLRIRNEAQLAAVLGHEYAHYQGQHSLRLYRNMRDKTNAMAWLSTLPVGGLAGAGVSLASIGIGASIFSFSREMEEEADAGSVTMLGQAGYRAGEAARIWEQLRSEMDATGAARGRKSRKDDNGGLFASHPPTAERMATLAALATAQPVSNDSGDDRYRAALAGWWPGLIDDQIKLNDFGATKLLLTALAADGWTAELRYAEGEMYRARGHAGDFARAAEAYRLATADPAAPAEAWRGLGLAQLRAGAAADGQTALRRYLTLRPGAGDRAMLAMLAGSAP